MVKSTAKSFLKNLSYVVRNDTAFEILNILDARENERFTYEELYDELKTISREDDFGKTLYSLSKNGGPVNTFSEDKKIYYQVSTSGKKTIRMAAHIRSLDFTCKSFYSLRL